MTQLGRKPRSIPRQKRHLRIREDLAATVDLILLDPMRQKVGYGKWSDLIEMLLRSWVAEQRSGKLRFTLSPEDMQKIRFAQQVLQATPLNNTQVVAASWLQVTQLLREVFDEEKVFWQAPISNLGREA